MKDQGFGQSGRQNTRISLKRFAFYACSKFKNFFLAQKTVCKVLTLIFISEMTESQKSKEKVSFFFYILLLKKEKIPCFI